MTLDPQWIAAGSKVLAAAMAPAPAAPSNSIGTLTVDAGLRNDSWTVATSRGQSSATTSRTESRVNPDGSALPADAPMRAAPSWLLGAALLLLAWPLLRPST